MEALSHNPRARNSDPVSSHLAAMHITATGEKRSQQRTALAAVQKNPYKTSFELSLVCPLERHQIARRLPELEEAGFIKKGIIRRCAVGGRKSVTWVAMVH